MPQLPHQRPLLLGSRAALAHCAANRKETKNDLFDIPRGGDELLDVSSELRPLP